MMKNAKYAELKAETLTELENRFDYIPDEKQIQDISYSLNKHALKKTLRSQKLRLKQLNDSNL